jgi:N-glycosylase/DNA lyase
MMRQGFFMRDYDSVSFGSENGVSCTEIAGARHFSVPAIFSCGQAFRFDPVEDSPHGCEWSGAAFGRFVSVAQDGDRVTIYNSDREDFYGVWERYLSLDLDYGELNGDILSRSDSPALAAAVACGDGIRLLRQDPWETLCSFIISQNNNIPRIKGLVSALSAAAGDVIVCHGMEAHGFRGQRAFPSPAATAALGEDGIRELRTGFRAPYICGAASAVAGGTFSLSDVASASDAEASLMLQTLRGVGPKVAACTLLFGFGRTGAFPVDVWIRRVMDKYFPGEFRPQTLGPYAGLAQQYLFYWERERGTAEERK